MDKDQNTEQKIIEAARNVFIRKGYAGARMQEIADEAQINKALLHYYFRSKEKLFDKIFKQAFKSLIPNVLRILESDDSLEDTIRNFVDYYIDFINANRYLPSFILHEINQNPEKLAGQLPAENIPNTAFYTKIIREAEAGRIKFMSPVELFINLLSLCVFPFAARPILTQVFDMDEDQFNEFLMNRKKTIPNMIMAYLKAEN
ncbi:MAG: TetR/AcrR family transcriptional regulator [Candidatus Kapaibacterium sp.]